jgi:hypothetical protein
MTTAAVLDPTYLKRLGSDPIYFLHEVWRIDGKDKVAPLTPLDLKIAMFLAHGAPYKVLLAMRGQGKTTLAAIIRVCYPVFRDPLRQTLVVSKSEKHAKSFIANVRRLITRIPFLRHLAPRQGHRDGALEFDFGPTQIGLTQPSIRALGIGGMLEGNRAHEIIADDIETKRNTMTFESRLELRRLCAEFPNILYKSDRSYIPTDPLGITYLGTVKNRETIYRSLTAPEVGFEGRGFPIQYPTPTQKVLCFAPELAADLLSGKAKPGDPTCPERFPLTEIVKLRAANLIIKDEDGEPIDFFQENMLIAEVSGDDIHPFKLRDFILAPFKLDRERAPVSITWGTLQSGGESTRAPTPTDAIGDDCFLHPVFYDQINLALYTGTVARVDPAGRGRDQVGLAIASHLSGYVWIKCVAGLDGGASTDNMNAIAAALRTHGATLCRVEPNFGGDSFANLLQVACNQHALKPNQDPRFPSGWACTVELGEHASGQKEVRILAHHKPALDAHRVVLCPSVAADLDLQRQITRMTLDRASLKRDDKLETLAAVVHDWLNELRLDPTISAQRTIDRSIDQQLKEARRQLMPFLDKPRRRAWHEVG